MRLKTLAVPLLALSLVIPQLSTSRPDQERYFLRGCPGEENNPYDGYIWGDDSSICVPGLVTIETWYTPAPPYAYGSAVWYAPRVMEATAAYRQLPLDGYLDGVSLMSPSDIGRTVYLKRPGHDWEGPFLVVDCARRGDIWPVITKRGEIVEVGFQTAARWGMVNATEYDYGYDRPYRSANWKIEGVEVLKMDTIPDWIDHATPIDYVSWWAERAIFSNGNDTEKPVGLNPKYFPEYHPGWLWKGDGDPYPVGPYDDWFSILFGDDPLYQFDWPPVSLSQKWGCIVYSYCGPGIQEK